MKMIQKRYCAKYIFAFALAVFIYIVIYYMRRELIFNDEYKRKIQKTTYEAKNTNETKYITIFGDRKAKTVDITNEGDLKYILIWTKNNTIPFIYLQSGQRAFVTSNCEYTNCYVSNEQSYLRDITDWDAVLFHGPEYTWKHRQRDLQPPEKRSPEQKYVYVSIESAHYYPVCDKKFNNFFNWTWTYRTDGDVKWGYVDIRDTSGEIIGPKEGIDWEEEMGDLSVEDKNQLKTKTKAVAWFASNCNSISGREEAGEVLANYLAKYGLTVDIFGSCGKFDCSRDNMQKCWAILKEDYFFYLAYENSFSEDYVTEKFLHAIKSNTVPIVWGGADYDRFAPPGSYLNARDLEPEKLASLIYSLMQNNDEYSKYFRWKNYYSYSRDIESPETNAFCRMCKALNDPVKSKERKTYSDFLGWWNGKLHRPCR